MGLTIAQIAIVRSDQSSPRNVPGIDKPVIVVTGEINGNETWTADNYYVLRGAVFVRNAATLNIRPGTKIIGEAGSVGTLIVQRGGRLNAIGTREQPIVFTSDQRVGARSRGDWGGLIVNGRAPVNIPGGEGVGEADTGVYGGNDPNDNSGTIRYVRVEFAGVEFSPDNELNGIAFQGVGRGTTVDHVQIHMNRDDGLEWFGGTVDIKYAVVSNAADDSFDWTQGWIGRAQFIAVHQKSDDGDWGIEADNNEANHNFLPRANPADLQHDDLRRSGHVRGRGILPGGALPPRHRGDVPQFPGPGADPGAAADRPGDARSGEQRHDPDRCRCDVGAVQRRGHRPNRPGLHHQRPLPERQGRR